MPSFRRATPADLDLLLELGRRTVTDTFAQYNTPENMSAFLVKHYDRQHWQDDLHAENTHFVIADLPHAPAAAFARLCHGHKVPECVGDPAAWQIDKFYVDKPHIGAGLAHEMMQHCLNLISAAGAKTVYLSVWEHNARAFRFYQKWGFTRVGELIFPMGDDPQIDWWLKRELTRPPA